MFRIDFREEFVKCPWGVPFGFLVITILSEQPFFFAIFSTELT